ncbi:MAG: bestrophin family protein [Saprospiraceae bacterium]
MYVEKNFGLVAILRFSGWYMIWITGWATIVAALHKFTPLGGFAIPWLPVSVIGTAVAFYIGFKNNQAYDRLWEARKIWGAIINSSRAWGSSVRAFVTDQFADPAYAKTPLGEVHQRLIYRHIAWLYVLRNQLLIPTPWEHIAQGRYVGDLAEKRRSSYGIGLFDEGTIEARMKQFLPDGEVDRLANAKNSATQIIDAQAQDLLTLRRQGLIEDFRHMELQSLLNLLYDHQGKAERIKKFPLPRQYGSMSSIFVGIFIFLLPFGMAGAFSALGETGIWWSIPFTGLIGWVYMMMELVGDYSENPFEGAGNDIPMLNLCRVIEIDLREMLGETDLPPAIEPVNGVLM